MLVSRYGKECVISIYNKFSKINDLQFRTQKGLELHECLKTPDIIYSLITLFHESYYNTAFDTVAFGKEFYNVVDFLIKGVVPLELEFLAVNEILDEIEDILNNVTSK